MARWASLPSDWGQALRTPIQPRPSSRGFRGSKIEAMGAMGAIGAMATVQTGATTLRAIVGLRQRSVWVRHLVPVVADRAADSPGGRRL